MRSTRLFLREADVRLRAVEPADASLMWEVENDSSQWMLNGMSAPFSRDNLLQYATTYDADPFRAGQLRLMAEIKGTGIIGIVDLYQISALHRTAYIGIYILPQMRGQGYAEICLRLLEDYASSLLNLRILAARVAEENIPSVKLFENAGYSHAGTLHDWLQSGNRTLNVRLYEKQLLPQV